MRAAAMCTLLGAMAMMSLAGRLRSQEIVDRIVARIENDIILWSNIRALGRYQQFVDGKSETDGQILDRLIDQWIVRTEANVAHFPQPSETEIDRSLERLRKSFPTAEEFTSRKKQCGLSDADLREMTAAQLFLGNYLESRFRPAVQVDSKAIEDFYAQEVVPRSKAGGQEPPSLDSARDAIQEALVQRGINEQAEQWLKESRARLHIEKLLQEGTK